MKKCKRALVLVADGFGVGAMDDCGQVRPSSLGSNSFLHVTNKEKKEFPNLKKLGMTEFLGLPEEETFPGVSGVGKCALYHYGADSYEGHNEIMGNKPKMPEHQTMALVGDKVEQALKNKGYDTYRVPGSTVIIVDHCVAVADNMETDHGQVINVTGCLDLAPFSKILDIGWIVRKVVKTNRVISFGGTKIREKNLVDAIIHRDGSCGIDTPQLNIYDDDYQVRHMGFGIDPDCQAQSILEKAGVPVYLLGKMADVIDGDVHYRKSLVHTDVILEEIKGLIKEREPGFISATCQQTDLAGHMGDSAAYAHVLQLIDDFLPELFELFDDGDMLIITGDHGNDPTCCGSAHSREYTPFLVYIKGQESGPIVRLGTRDTLADVAATVCSFYGADAPEFGQSALDSLIR